jgi:hypothetical protein
MKVGEQTTILKMKGSQMKTSLEVDSLLASPQPLSAAANEEFVAAARASTGWDPYEVWRTRVKAAQDSSEAQASCP